MNGTLRDTRWYALVKIKYTHGVVFQKIELIHNDVVRYQFVYLKPLYVTGIRNISLTLSTLPFDSEF